MSKVKFRVYSGVKGTYCKDYYSLNRSKILEQQRLYYQRKKARSKVQTVEVSHAE